MCEVVYSAEMAITGTEWTEIQNRIDKNRPKGFPVWAKESLAFAIVMAGAAFIIHSYIPAQIGSQTSTMSVDVASLKTDVSTIKNEVSEIRKDIKDVLIKSLDSARQELQQNKQSPTQGRRSALHLVSCLR